MTFDCAKPILGPLGSVVGHCDRQYEHDGPCSFNGITEQTMLDRLNADEPWTAIGAFAIQTRSIATAVRIAAKLSKRVKRSRQEGTLDGVKWMCLARFESSGGRDA